MQTELAGLVAIAHVVAVLAAPSAEGFLWLGQGTCPGTLFDLGTTNFTTANCAQVCYASDSCEAFDIVEGVSCQGQSTAQRTFHDLVASSHNCYAKYIPGAGIFYDEPTREMIQIFNWDLTDPWEPSLGTADLPSLEPSYWQDDTFVYLQGSIAGGSSGVLLTLPYGFRPANLVTLIVTTDPMDEYSYNMVYNNNATNIRWTVPDEGLAYLGVNFGKDKTLDYCRYKCTSLMPECLGFWWGHNVAWGGQYLCIALYDLIPKSAGGISGYSYKREIEQLGTMVLEIYPNGTVYLPAIAGDNSVNFQGHFPYVKVTTCSETGEYDVSGDMIYQTYDTSRPLDYRCTDVDTSLGKYIELPLAAGVENTGTHANFSAYEELETGFVHLRGTVTVDCCPNPRNATDGFVDCDHALCLIAEGVPMPDWPSTGKKAVFVQMETYRSAGLHYGRYIEIHVNGSIYVSSSSRREVNLDSITILTLTEETSDVDHIGSAVQLVTPSVFWSFDSTQSPLREVRDYHGRVCLAGGLLFSTTSLAEQLVGTLDEGFRPSFRTKHPIACYFSMADNSRGSRQCALTVEPTGEMRVAFEENYVVSGAELDGGHWISLEGVCFEGFDIAPEMIITGNAEVQLTGQAELEFA